MMEVRKKCESSICGTMLVLFCNDCKPHARTTRSKCGMCFEVHRFVYHSSALLMRSKVTTSRSFSRKHITYCPKATSVYVLQVDF